MPDLRFHCKHCKGQLVVDARGMGRELPCPKCGEIVTIPLRSEDPVETPKPPSEAQGEPTAGGAGDTCTRCGKKVVPDKYAVAVQCREAGIPLNWGALTPTLSQGSDTATGINDIFDLLSRSSEEKLNAFQSIIGSWAPHGRCPTCGEQWCQRCIMGPLPYNAMGQKPHCKCG